MRGKRAFPSGPGAVLPRAAWSLIALGITNIDPLKYNLLFERFLNPERKSMPDIDTDFCIERRDEIIKYTAEKYGADQRRSNHHFQPHDQQSRDQRCGTGAGISLSQNRQIGEDGAGRARQTDAA